MSVGSVQRFRNTLEKREKEIVEKKAATCPQIERLSNLTNGPEVKEASRTGFSKALLRHEITQENEAKLAHVALVLVRREALRRVLEEEKRLFSKELSKKGLAIYQQRI